IRDPAAHDGVVLAVPAHDAARVQSSGLGEPAADVEGGAHRSGTILIDDAEGRAVVESAAEATADGLPRGAVPLQEPAVGELLSEEERRRIRPISVFIE